MTRVTIEGATLGFKNSLKSFFFKVRNSFGFEPMTLGGKKTVQPFFHNRGVKDKKAKQKVKSSGFLQWTLI